MTITITGGSSGARKTPADVIAASSLASLLATKIIQVNDNLVIDGFYDDTGWFYYFQRGKMFSTGTSCDWVSGKNYYGQLVQGFNASIESTGHSKNFNAAGGGKITWKNVSFHVRSGRSDFIFNKLTTETNYDIDGFFYDHSDASGGNVKAHADLGEIKNITFIRANLSLSGSKVSSVTYVGLNERGAEAKVSPTENDYHLNKFSPYLANSGTFLAIAVSGITGVASQRRVFFDNLIIPDFFDHMKNIKVYSGGTITSSRSFKLDFKDSLGAKLSDVKVLVENTSDFSSSFTGTTSELDELLPVYVGIRNDVNNYRQPESQTDYQIKKFYCWKYGFIALTIPDINMKVNSYESSVFLVTDSFITERNENVAAAYTELENFQKLYDRITIEWLKQTTTLLKSQQSVTAKENTIVFPNSYINGIEIGANALSITGFVDSINIQTNNSKLTSNIEAENNLTLDAIEIIGNVKTTGTITLRNGASIQGAAEDSSGKEASITFTDLVDSSIYITNSSDVKVSFESDITGTKTAKVKNVDDIHKVVIARAGYQKQQFAFETHGTVSRFAVSYDQLLDVDASAMYKNVVSSNISFSYNSGKITGTLTGDVTAPFFFDGLEQFLVTEDGGKWLLENNLAQAQRFNLAFSGQFLNLPVNLNFRGASRRILAFIASAENPLDVTLNGSVIYNLASNALLDDINKRTKKIWQQLNSSHVNTVTLHHRVISDLDIDKANLDSAKWKFHGTNSGTLSGTNNLVFSSDKDIEIEIPLDDKIALDKIIVHKIRLSAGWIENFEISAHIIIGSDPAKEINKFLASETDGWGVISSMEHPLTSFAFIIDLFKNTGVTIGFTKLIIKIKGKDVSSDARMQLNDVTLYEDQRHLQVVSRPSPVNVVEINGTEITNIDDFKATKTDANIVEVKGSSVTDIGDFKASTTNVDLTSLNPKFAEIKTETDKIKSIKTETDKLSFDSSGFVKSDIQSVKTTGVTNIEDFKATKTDANILEVKGVAVTNIRDFKATKTDANIVEVKGLAVDTIDDFKGTSSGSASGSGASSGGFIKTP